MTEFVSFGEDLELDIPKVWDNLSEVMATLAVQDSRLLPLPFLQPCVQPLKATPKKMATLVTALLKHAADITVS
jgi:hypothetical protein